MIRYSLVNDWLCGGVNHSTVPWQHTCPGLNFAISISLCTGLISCGPYCKRMKQDGYEMKKQQMRSIVISNKLFYNNCIFSYPVNASNAGGDLALIDLSAYSLKCQLVSIRTTWFTHQKQWHLYQNKVTCSLAAIQRPGHWAGNCKIV